MPRKISRTALLLAMLSALALPLAAERFRAEPIHWAAYEGNLKKVNKLIDAGADVNIQGSTGATALFGAAAGNHSDICEVLLDAGADVGIRSDNGWTALMVADLGDCEESIEVLRRHGAKLNKLEAEAIEALRPDCSFKSGKAYGMYMAADTLQGDEHDGVVEIANILSGSCPEFLKGLKSGIWQGSMAGLVVPARVLANATKLRGINARLKKLDALADKAERDARPKRGPKR